MKNKFTRCTLVVATASLLAAFPASAVNSFFHTGDLILTIQQFGSTNTVYADIGNPATAFRGAAAGASDGVNNINFLDLSSTLNTAFPGGWANSTELYVGLAACWSGGTTGSQLQDGDPKRTLYVSSARNVLGTVGTSNSALWDLSGSSSTDMTSAAGAIISQNDVFNNLYNAQVAISPTSDSQIDDNQPLVHPTGGVTSQGTAFGVFGGGVQQAGTASALGTFGPAGSVEFALDLNRILAKTNAAGQVGGNLQNASYEGTVTIGTNGMVSFVAVPEPSSVALLGLAAGGLVLRRRRSA